jgi:hypothetical protein
MSADHANDRIRERSRPLRHRARDAARQAFLSMLLPLLLTGCAAGIQESERRGDCARLELIALDASEDFEVREKAISALGRIGTDNAARCMMRVATTAKSDIAVLAARNMGRNQDLIDLALHAGSEDVLGAAVARLANPEDVYSVFRQSTSPRARRRIMEQIQDENLLYRIFREDQSFRDEAFSRIRGQNTLLDIVQGESTWDYRYRAFQKLDKASLENLGRQAKDSALVVAARILLGQIGWDAAFSRYGTGDVLGAAALVERSKPRSEVVVAACHQFIRQGDASRIPELVKLIHEYGDVSLAEDYMNCGQSDLESAGRAWGRAHGYDVGSGNGSHRVQWGSGGR